MDVVKSSETGGSKRTFGRDITNIASDPVQTKNVTKSSVFKAIDTMLMEDTPSSGTSTKEVRDYMLRASGAFPLPPASVLTLLHRPHSALL